MNGDYQIIDVCIFDLDGTRLDIDGSPETLSYEKAALVEPLSVEYYGVRIGGFKTGMTAVVTGASPIGLAVVMSLKALGVGKIIVVEKLELRQKFAIENGADVVLDPDVDVVEEGLALLTGGGKKDHGRLL